MSFAFNADQSLQSLIEAGSKDSKSVEFFTELPDTGDAGLTDFLGDVSSFANASGGHLVYGVDPARPGNPVIKGIDSTLIHQALGRLRSALENGIDPGIPGVDFSVSTLREDKSVLIVRIPRSWSGPHMLVHQQAYRFMSRNSTGKYFLDVGELRSMFNKSEDPSRSMNLFHVERIHTLLGRPMSIALPPTPKIVLHMFPLASFHDPKVMPMEEVRKSHSDFMRPMDARGINSHFNFDGLMNFSSIEKYAYSHVQLFRNGCLEACNGSLLDYKDGRKHIPSERFEPEIITCGNRFIELLRRIKVEPPYAVRLSFLGVRGYSMFVGPMRWQAHAHTIERDHIFLEEILVEGSDANFSAAMRPAFDHLWNACGWPRSLNYDDNGNWREFTA